MRYLLLAASVTVIAFLGLTIDRQSQPPSEYTEPLPLDQQERIFAAGWIEGRTEAIELRPQLAGRISEVRVVEGDEVEQGQTLLVLDDAEYRHALSLAKAELAAAEARLERMRAGARSEELREARALLAAKEAELERARTSLKRIEGLLRSEAAPPQEADDARALVKSLQAQVDAAQARIDLLEAGARKEDIRIAETEVAARQAQVALAEVRLQRCRLKAPCAAKVLHVPVEPGELAGPEMPRPAVVLSDTSKLRVRAYVEELDAPRVEVGMRARVTVDGLPGKVFVGKVQRISPRMMRKTLFRDAPEEHYDVKTREIWIDLESADDALVVGLRVDVMLLRGES